MPNTKYYAQINSTILDRVRSLTVEKNLTQYSGKFSLSVSDPTNTYYNQFTSGDELEVIENYIPDTIEHEQSYTTAPAINWYKFNDTKTDSKGTNNFAFRSDTYAVETPITFGTGKFNKSLDFTGSVFPINELSGTDVIPFGKSGVEADGTVTGAVLCEDGFGHADSAYDFGMDEGRIEIGALNRAYTGVTVSAWIYVESLNTYQSILDNEEYLDGGATQRGWTFRIGTDGKLSAICGDKLAGVGSMTGKTTTAAVPTNAWVHVAFTWASGDTKIYIEGVNQTTTGTNFSGTIPALGAVVATIGGMRNINNFEGKIDDVHIYNRALTQTEITALYNRESVATTPDLSDAHYYPFTGNAQDVSRPIEKLAQSFVCPANGTIHLIGFKRASNTGTNANTQYVEIWSDNAGSPNAIVSSFTWSWSSTNWDSWSTTSDNYNRSQAVNAGLTPGTTYWLVWRKSANSDANYPNLYYDSTNDYGTLKRHDGVGWKTQTGALRFAIGYTDWVVLDSDITLAPNAFSVSWWMKTTNTEYECLFSKNVISSSGQIEINSISNLRFESNTNNAFTKTIPTGITISDGIWHHYVLTSGVTAFRLYVDKNLAYETTANEDTANQIFRYIGAFQSAPNGTYGLGFSGSMDDVRFFTKELSAHEVREVYDNLAETKVFGGYCENVNRDKDDKYVLNIDGGDYTTKLNNIMVLGEVYNNREFSVIIRDIMHKYVMNTNIIDKCESTTGWTATDGTLTLETGLDTNNNPIARLGDGCLKIVPTAAAGNIYNALSFELNWESTDYFVCYFYVQDVSKLNSVSLDLGQDSSNYYNISAPKQTIVSGWNYLEFDMSTATTVGTPSLDAVDYVQINWNLDDTTNVLYFDHMRRSKHSSTDFSLTNVQTTNYYTSKDFKNKSVYDCIRKICDIYANTYDFYVDLLKILNFGEFGEIDSGEVLQRGINVIKSNFKDDDTKLCNKVTVYGAKQQFGLVETFDGDSTETEFILKYQPISQKVYVGGVLKQGYVQGMSSTTYDYRVDYENRKITFTTAPTTGTGNISVDYTYGVPIIVQRQDDESIVNYKLREQKIENENILTKEDAVIVANEYIESWKDPVLNASFVSRINPNIDIGERVGVIDKRYFGDDIQRDFGVVSVKHTFIGGKMSTESTLTLITKTVEMYLQDIFSRLSALEEEDTGSSDVLNRLISPAEEYLLLDDPADNLVIKQKNIAGDTLIWGSPDYGIWGTYKWGSAASSSFVLGLAKLGVNGLGSVTSDWGSNLVVNPSE